MFKTLVERCMLLKFCFDGSVFIYNSQCRATSKCYTDNPIISDNTICTMYLLVVCLWQWQADRKSDKQYDRQTNEHLFTAQTFHSGGHHKHFKYWLINHKSHSLIILLSIPNTLQCCQYQWDCDVAHCSSITYKHNISLILEGLYNRHVLGALFNSFEVDIDLWHSATFGTGH